LLVASMSCCSGLKQPARERARVLKVLVLDLSACVRMSSSRVSMEGM